MNGNELVTHVADIAGITKGVGPTEAGERRQSALPA